MLCTATQANESVAAGLPIDFWTIDLRTALMALGEVSGDEVGGWHRICSPLLPPTTLVCHSHPPWLLLLISSCLMLMFC